MERLLGSGNVEGYILDLLRCAPGSDVVLDVKGIVDIITSEHDEYDRVDVVRGIIELGHRGLLVEKYPGEYQIGLEW